MTDQNGKVGCPAAFMIDDDAREKALKDLEKEIDKRNVVIDNVNWHRMDEPRCNRSNQDWKLDAQKMLNMDEDDLREADEYINKKMGPPTP